MSFGSPYLLVLLVCLPIVAAVSRLLDRRRQKRSVNWSNASLLPNIVQLPARNLRSVPLALFLLGLTFLVVGFARPRRIVTSSETNAPTVVLAFDVSGSMAARDLAPTRLHAARDVALRFLHGLPASDRVAVLTFGDAVRIPVPPTTDRQAVISHFPRAITPKAGTSLGDAVTAGVAVVVEAAGNNIEGSSYPGLVLVLSDGDQTAGGATPAAAASTAFVERVPVDTVAIGTAHGTVTQPMQVNGFNANVRLPAPVDPGTMQSIAHEAAGRAYTVTSAAQATPVGAKLAALDQKLAGSTQRQRHVQQLSAALGGAALALIVAGFVVSGLWYGRVA